MTGPLSRTHLLSTIADIGVLRSFSLPSVQVPPTWVPRSRVVISCEFQNSLSGDVERSMTSGRGLADISNLVDDAPRPVVARAGREPLMLVRSSAPPASNFEFPERASRAEGGPCLAFRVSQPSRGPRRQPWSAWYRTGPPERIRYPSFAPFWGFPPSRSPPLPQPCPEPSWTFFARDPCCGPTQIAAQNS